MNQTPVAVDLCPACGAPFDRVFSNGPAPEPGMLSICVQCGAIVAFGPDLRTELPRPDWRERLEPGHAAVLERVAAGFRRAREGP